MSERKRIRPELRMRRVREWLACWLLGVRGPWRQFVTVAGMHGRVLTREGAEVGPHGLTLSVDVLPEDSIYSPGSATLPALRPWEATRKIGMDAMSYDSAAPTGGAPHE